MTGESLVGLIPLIMMMLACASAVLIRGATGLATGLVPAVVAGLLIQMTESAMFGTGQAYPFIFWPAVAAALVLGSAAPIDTKQTRVTTRA